MQPKNFSKFLMLLALSTVLSLLTIVFGAIPMRASRRTFGRLAFWVGHIAVALAFAVAGLGSYALAFFALAVMVGVYSEVEEHGGSLFTSGITAILATTGVSALTVGGWLHHTKANLVQSVKMQMAPLAERLSSVNPEVQIKVETIMQQLPSGLLILLMVAMAVALIWERRIYTWFRLERPVLLLDLRAFRVPDLTVWVVALVILGAFLKHGQPMLEMTSVNALNVLVVLYFFQGLAVVAQAFRIFRVSPIWQGFWYLLIVLQLFLVVSFVGFADYWLEFRDRLTRKPAEPNKSF